jgi:hypothetical protein
MQMSAEARGRGSAGSSNARKTKRGAIDPILLDPNRGAEEGDRLVNGTEGGTRAPRSCSKLLATAFQKLSFPISCLNVIFF